MEDTIKQTPMMDQYLRFKKQYPDKIVLFRMGDFFETFGDDAKITSKVLNITLTARDKSSNPTPLAGFPHKAIDQYLPKLVKGGHCVVIVDQLEDPKLAKGIVKRGVTRIVTPGTLDTEDSVKSNYICAFCKIKNDLGVSICDISTGELVWIKSKYTIKNIEGVISSFDPSEILLLENEKDITFPTLPVQFLSKAVQNIKYAEELIKEFFSISNIESLGLENEDSSICALSMILKHIQETQLMEPTHIKKPARRNLNSNMILDRATIRNLELVNNSYGNGIQSSLFSVIDYTSTQMGKRLLYSWILNPLIEKKKIDERLNIVEMFLSDTDVLNSTKEILSQVSDIERIVGKIGLGRVNGRDIKALQISLEQVVKLRKELLPIPELAKLYDTYDSLLQELVERIDNCIVDSPPPSLLEGGIIKSTYNEKVRELRELSGDSKSWIKDFEEEEKKSTGINTLKIGFNRVFGYYIEVTRTHQEKVPERYIRKQTLVNSERYITEELKQKEDIILTAQDKLNELEYKLFTEFRESLIPNITQLQELSSEISKTDVLSGFAQLSIDNKYCKPIIYEMGEQKGLIKIESGRHPVVESIGEEEFISNDTYLDSESSVMSILTGPNMSGKSTYIRQVAILVLLAQIGCYVPAKSMEISLVDRIFTRVGASDDLSRGRSTFMVEMDEAANIVNNATKYSLIVLDEVGRGTSTYDGVSIAWALAEHLVKELKARTLFATHYHELLKLSEKIPDKVKNYNVLVEEDINEGTVIFLRKIVEGGTDRSYGIYVAKMAGLPEKVIKRANEILESFEQEQMFTGESNLRESKILESKNGNNGQSSYQFPLFLAKESEIEREIQQIDTDNLTPIEALNKINEWKKKV
ncbi:MAG: mismatch repair protein MutS protein [candidate division WS6 bacterium GW2011_GWE1_34_7]|uniref:DNA mismatch repair protein MutS n=1 Tax=candidate division WS6 bacterium GW2011_GWE1_34_7 TaxID=1619093 RepID=A0A0G0B9B9_9BACT|nr:MAG: mismatch repair protein MutS protein [candidate division WS6 bacterium GW2011_GWE1_34_7]